MNNRFQSLQMRLLVALVLLTGLWACKPKDDKNQPGDTSFDRGAMLIYTADSLILPDYRRAELAARTLRDSVATFVANPTTPRLEALRTQWFQTALAWQPLGAYDFGPALLTSGTLSQETATFPVDTARVASYIQAADFSLDNFYPATRGLYAIEYLLYRFSASDYGSNNNRSQYLVAIANRLHTNVSGVQNSWEGSYRGSFVNNTGTDAGSSIALYFNAFVKHFEALKNYKLGLPLGLRAGQTSTEPTRVEGYFSGRSVELAQAHFRNTENQWRGRTRFGHNGIGFDDYLQAVQGGPDLANSTTAQMATTTTALAALPTTPLSAQITASVALPTAAFDELQRLTRFLKSELSSLLGISITYSSGDGD